MTEDANLRDNAALPIVDELDAQLTQTLAEVFGFRSFRPYQREIARAIIEGRDVFAIMPTGGGKSLCYQLPSLIRQGVCVVVSPLLSLMKDQVDSAVKNGMNAATINSTTSAAEWREIMVALDRNQLNLLYVSPERFCTPSFAELLSEINVGFFAVDEAHCISQWGHNFRAEYLGIGDVVERFPSCPVAAFTATATSIVGDDIKSSLKLRDPLCIRASFDRPNLFYQIAYKENVDDQIVDFLKSARGESGIVYRSTRKKVEQTAATLRERGFNAEAYHAGMSDEDRAAVQERFANDETPIIVATIAFGMGIDKSNVRFVVHGDLPKDVESYYQETGRAGRDGAPARCLLLYGYQDVVIYQKFLEDYEDETAKEAASKRLDEMVRFAESDSCRRVNLLKYFGETYAPVELTPEENDADTNADSEYKPRSATYCGACDICVGASPREDATIEAQKALSAMQRTGNRFGSSHIIDVLVGKKTEKIERFHHDELPTFGVGADHTRIYWKYLLQALLSQGLATLAPDFEFPIPQVSQLGWEVMRGQRQVQIIKRPEKRRQREKRLEAGKTSIGFNRYSLSPQDLQLFELLRAKRSEIATAERVPPYVVFNDKTLVDMVYLKPQSDENFLLVQGVGRAKLKNYGRKFMSVIKKFLEENGESREE